MYFMPFMVDHAMYEFDFIHGNCCFDLDFESSSHKSLLDVLARVLIRCFRMDCALLLLWAAFMAAGDTVFAIHGKLLGIGRSEFNLVWYGGMAFLKVLAIVFFLFPYLGIRWILRPNGGDSRGQPENSVL
jgi:hypothetical protein